MNLAALGAQIQAARTERGLTLQALADRSDVSVSMLSSVERGAKAPTIVVLDRIANGLGLPLAELLTPPKRMIVRRAADQDTVHEPGGWQRTILTPVVPGVNFEWIRSTLPPDCEAGTYPPYAAGSHEFIVVQTGTLTLTVDGEVVILGEGDSLYLAADVTLTYANHSDMPCTYYVAALIMRPRRPGLGRRPAGQ
ncbi:transcriptional regulator with XRE-family HTH domain [Amycolatopsis bartoniae]|uniref:XRE family transcriptional regulator n=1 Tax=Amycolatopsis bartoniae TaxID=941986 RepID=A0A8H9MAE0_9PSEU|nr:XRE family transcriptional regulator [Amycolatopsis bartoniae]MBB2933067.1 transcriptional regulator with XRE-family HTH domain [Amycolatopsis bartoniae]TVT11922.1 helix-turn-helix domain-containing protein [Amycolatopsis bartoniae]GHF56810.1 XRE family transcriptional regulator [Amycolatopsis bartoniae]